MIPTVSKWRRWTLPSKASYGGFIVGIAGIGIGLIFYFNPRPSPPSAADEYVRRANPTTLTVEAVSFERWLGDEEEAITVSINNSSELDADSIELQFLTNTGPLPAFISKAFESLEGVPLSLAAGNTVRIPIASVMELNEKIRGQVCAISIEAPSLSYPQGCEGAYAVDQYLHKVKVRYKTIFGEQRIDDTSVWVSAMSHRPQE